MKRIKWIDFLKGIAIIAVVLDHTNIFFPRFLVQFVLWHTYFSVNWFIFLSGLLSGISLNKFRRVSLLSISTKFYKSKLWLVYWYLLVSIVYWIFSNSKFDIIILLNYVISFNSGYHLYFLLILFQLFLLTPALYKLIYKLTKLSSRIIFIFLIIIFTLVLFPLDKPPWKSIQNFYFISWSYLAVYLLGVTYSFYYEKNNSLIMFLTIIVFVLSEIYLIYKKGSFAIGTVNIVLTVWSVAFLFTAMFLIKKYHYNNIILKVIDHIGQKSLIIYLLHYFILKYISDKKLFGNTYIEIFIIYTMALFIPIILDMAINILNQNSKKLLLGNNFILRKRN
jgi:fucose 4-O-acetylase-like acetyltransferase